MTDADRLQMIFTTISAMSGHAMLWWVSATAMSVTIFGIVWTRQKALQEQQPLSFWVFVLGTVFFVTVIASGILYSVWSGIFLSEVPAICERLTADTGLPCPEAATSWFVPWAIALGTTSFVIALVIWIGTYCHIQPKGRRIPYGKGKPQERPCNTDVALGDASHRG